MRRSWSIPPSRLRRATVPQFNMVASLRSHRTARRLPGVPWLRTVLRSVCSPLQPFGPPPFAKRTCDVPCFTGVFVPACASLARYSGAAERFALFLNSAWSSHCARKLACGTPCFIGLTSACFAHCARPPCAPRPSTPSGLRRLRPVSATGGGLRTPLFPSGKRRLLAGQLLTIALLTKRLPLIRRGRTKRARCARSSAK